MDPTIAGLLGTLLGALIGFLGTLHVTRKQERYRSSNEFVSAFIELQRLLRVRHPNHPGEYKNVRQLIEEHYIGLSSAVLKFQYLLGVLEKTGFEKKWKELICFDDHHKYPTFDDYKCSPNHNEQLEKRDLALDRIEALLAYAKFK